MKERLCWLGAGFIESFGRSPDRPALEIDGETITYAGLYNHASSLSATLLNNTPSDGPALTAILAYRSAAAFVGVLAALFRGHGYVPLNPLFPPERTRTMLKQAGCRALVIDSTGEKQLDSVLKGIDEQLVLVFPERDDVADLVSRFPQHTVLGSRDIVLQEPFVRSAPGEDSVAYLLFTSGSTGMPKGVMISHRNVIRFLDVMCERYALNETDRLSQMFEMVFDLSIFDMFMAWQVGACLCCPSRQQLLLPASYIQESEITVWFSVPSVAILLKRLGFLESGVFPGLRLSLFCGEALPAEVTDAWSEAAPNSVLENLYGPTEVTVACTVYRWQPQKSANECENGIVPIGEPFPGMTAMVADDELREVAPGQTGELLMSGPQVALGYWRDRAKTSKAFIEPPDREGIYYRTGDLVRRPVDSRPLIYLGRIDHQVKIHGSRVELGEIEAVLREAAGVHRAVALGWPVTATGADGIVAFLESSDADLDHALHAVRARLPGYMVPREIHLLPEFPLNPNGKVDRKALLNLLEE